MEYCKPCGRYFGDEKALQQHRQMSSEHAYCWQCQKVFGSQSAKEQHIRDSEHHHVCYTCNDRPDFYSEGDLENHARTVHNRCTECDITFGSSRKLAQHGVVEHNICDICGEGFASPSNLDNVSALLLDALENNLLTL